MNARTIPALMTAAAIGKLIDKTPKMVSDLREHLHDTAIQCLMHAQSHGDVTLCQRLFESLGNTDEKKSVIRAEAMKVWMGEHSPITARQGVWSLKKGWTKDMFLIQQANDTPFWEFTNDITPQTVSAESILNIVKGLLKRVDKAQGEGRFVGDVSATKAMVEKATNVIEVEFNKLSPTQKGMADKTADTILEAAKTGGQQSKTVAA